MSSFICEKQWPFENVNCFIDETYESWDCFPTELRRLLVVYNCPINAILQHRRIFHNNHFAKHVSTPVKTTRRRSIHWSCDKTDQLNQFLETLQTIASDHVDKLDIKWLDKDVSQTMILDSNMLLFEGH